MNSEVEFRIRKLQTECFDILFGSKNHDYNSSGVDVLDYFPYGYMSALTEINRKVLRLMSLYGQGIEPKHESVEDTWRDLINYSYIGYGITKTMEARELPSHSPSERKKKRKKKMGK